MESSEDGVRSLYHYYLVWRGLRCCTTGLRFVRMRREIYLWSLYECYAFLIHARRPRWPTGTLSMHEDRAQGLLYV